MKKITTIFAVLTVLITLTTSCNKKIKEDMEDLEKSLNEQKSKNDNLQNQVNTLNGILTRTPMSVKFSTRDNDDATVAWEGSLSFTYGSDYGYSYIEDNGDGTYYIYIWRGGDLGTDFYAEVEFDYNPTTKVASTPYARHRSYYSKQGSVSATFSGTTNIIHSVTVNSFDFNAGTISLNYTGTTTGSYGGNRFTGKPMTLELGYSGPMAKYLYN